jgi:hypothetical protein
MSPCAERDKRSNITYTGKRRATRRYLALQGSSTQYFDCRFLIRSTSLFEHHQSNIMQLPECPANGNCLGTFKSSHEFHEFHGFCMITFLMHVESMEQLHVFQR